MSCILVGNGTSILDKTNGSLIDSFDSIVRFNAYTINGFEPHTGRRVTDWFNVINYQNPEEWRLKMPYQSVWIHSWQWDRGKDKMYQTFLPRFHPLVLHKTMKADLDEMVAFANTPEYRTYSTGAIAIWIMLRSFPNVTITGFDWWDRTEHHYNDKAPRGSLHKPQIEKIFIDKLTESGKLFRL